MMTKSCILLLRCRGSAIAAGSGLKRRSLCLDFFQRHHHLPSPSSCRSWSSCLSFLSSNNAPVLFRSCCGTANNNKANRSRPFSSSFCRIPVMIAPKANDIITTTRKVDVRAFSTSTTTHRTYSTTSTSIVAASQHQVQQQQQQQRWRKSTKQVATLGPTSNTKEMIEKLFLAGADVFRLNFSHGNHTEKLQFIHHIRSIENKYHHPIAILGDLQGPKLRLGEFMNPNGEILEKGQTFRLDLDPIKGNQLRIQLPHPEIIQASQIGHSLLIDDGKVKLQVIEKGDNYLNCSVIVPGHVKDRKGVNTPDSILNISPLTKKDRMDLEFMLQSGIDWIALSFVQKPADMEEIHNLIESQLSPGKMKPAIMAKIEKPSCFEGDHLQGIVRLSDGIMVARGDLGVEAPLEDVPLLQKVIVDECRRQGRPVVVATQMLESMIESPTPTRAEASDVATAIYDGADAIMLSAESASGKYPEESVLMQQRIINRVESHDRYRDYLNQGAPPTENSPTDAIITAARQIAHTINAKAIVSFSLRGTTIRRASTARPSVPILALCPFPETSRQLALSWGVYPDLPKDGSYGSYPMVEEGRPLLDKTSDFDVVLQNACRAALDKGLVSSPNDLLVVTAGLPFGIPGAANIIRVVHAAGPSFWDGQRQ